MSGKITQPWPKDITLAKISCLKQWRSCFGRQLDRLAWKASSLPTTLRVQRLRMYGGERILQWEFLSANNMQSDASRELVSPSQPVLISGLAIRLPERHTYTRLSSDSSSRLGAIC
jgi:hypothetical protein